MTRHDRFKRGDVVVHRRRPEWGRGIVQKATLIRYEGRPAQRLVINFEHRAAVTLNTAVAPLTPKGTESAMSTTRSSTLPGTSTNGGWLGALAERNGSDHGLTALPEAMTDPFTSEARRLEATLDSYRFSTEPRSLVDWAIAQTGLHDPLSHYTRQELEHAFGRFARDRDQHLLALVRTIKKQGAHEVLQRAMSTVRNPHARAALKKAIRA